MARVKKDNIRVTTKSRATEDEPEDVDNAAEEAEEAADDARFQRMLDAAEAADEEERATEDDRRRSNAERMALPLPSDQPLGEFKRGGPVKAAVRDAGRIATASAKVGFKAGRASKPTVVAVVAKPLHLHHKGGGHPSRGAYSK